MPSDNGTIDVIAAATQESRVSMTNNRSKLENLESIVDEEFVQKQRSKTRENVRHGTLLQRNLATAVTTTTIA